MLSTASSPSLLLLLLFLFLLLSAEVRSYEAPEDKQDVFARRACPAFLTFTNAAYLSGVTVELPCHCKPQQIQSVVWFFRKHLDGSKETRALTDHHGNMMLDPNVIPHGGDLRSRFFIRLFSLLIFRAGAGDSGVYICGSVHKDFFYAFDLDIQEARTLSLGPSTSKKSKVRTALGATGPLYRVFTGFRSWSVCDRCGVPGEQVRVGLCYVHSRYLHARYRRANQTVASCGSGAVPRAFGRPERSGGGGATLEVRRCQATCQTEAPPSSTLLALMTFLGYNSGSLPVFFMNHPAGRVLTLGCPGARPNMAVAWDKGVEPIYRSQHLAGVDLDAEFPRLLIDTGHHLMFQPAEAQDSGVYYCWLQGQRTAEVRLLVYAHFGKRPSVVSHPDFWVALRSVFRAYAAMTAVFCLLLLSRAGLSYLRDAGEAHED